MTRPDGADQPAPPEPVGYAGPSTPRPPRTHARGWAAYGSLGLVLLNLPWSCGGLFRPVFAWVGGSWDTVDPRGFVIGRAVMEAPSILATLAACAALVGRRPGSYRIAAWSALVLTLGWLFFADLGAHFHIGD